MALGSVNFEVSPGIVSLIYFIVLDLTFLTLFDIVFAKVAALVYLRRIRKGKPLKVRSADVIGLSTYLVGSFRTPINILIIFIKLLLLGAIVYIDLGLGSDQKTITKPISVTGIFNFDPSSDTWDTKAFRMVERRFEPMRRCRSIDESTNEITFYALAFNLSGLPNGQTSIDNEVSSNRTVVKIDLDSMQCMGKGEVVNSSILPVAKVTGCSKYQTTNCRNGTVVVKQNVDLPYRPQDLSDIVTIDYGVIDVDYEVRRFSEIARPIFPPSYQNLTFNCIRNQFGIQDIWKDIFITCVVVAAYNDGKDTLVERWDYSLRTQVLSRPFPGPVFEGRLDFSMIQQILAMQNIILPGDWEILSSIIVADGAVYEKRSVDATRIIDERLVTVIPWSALVVTFVMGFFAISLRLASVFVLGSDEIIQLNTIDGLSSIAREENEPSGRSFKTGKHSVVGLTSRDGQRGVVHFGPMREKDVGVSRSRDIEVR